MSAVFSKLFYPTEADLDALIDKDPKLKSMVDKKQPYEIKMLAVMNLPFNSNPIQKKATKNEVIDKEGSAVIGFYRSK